MDHRTRIRGLKPHQPVSAEEWHRCHDAVSKAIQEDFENFECALVAKAGGFELELVQWLALRVFTEESNVGPS